MQNQVLPTATKKINITEALMVPAYRLKDNIGRLLCAPFCGLALLFAGSLFLALVFLVCFAVLSTFSIGINKVAFFSSGDHSALIDNIGVVSIFSLILLGIFCVLFTVASTALSIGIIYVLYTQLILDAYDNTVFSLPTLTGTLHRVPAYIGAFLLRMLFIFLGFCLFAVPGFIVQSRLSLFKFFVVEKKYGAVDSLIASYTCTRGNTLRLLVLDFLMYSITFMVWFSVSTISRLFCAVVPEFFDLLMGFITLSLIMTYSELINAHIYRTLFVDNTSDCSEISCVKHPNNGHDVHT